MKKVLLCVAAAWIVGGTVVVGNPGPDDFRFVKTLRAQSGVRHRIGRVPLDEEVLEHTDASFHGLRIFDDSDAETPLFIRTESDIEETTREIRVPAKPVSFEALPSNMFSMVSERTGSGKRREISIVELETSQRNFEKRVTVWEGDDGETWRLLVDDALIYDYSRYVDLRRSRVRIPPSTARLVRIRVSDVTTEEETPLYHIERRFRDGEAVGKVERRSLRRSDFRVDALRLLAEESVVARRESRLRPYTVSELEIETNSERNETVVGFRVPFAPIRRISLTIVEPFFSRRVSVEGSVQDDGDGTWRHLLRTTIRRVPGDEESQGELQIVLPGRGRYRRLRLTIENADSPPLTISDARSRGETFEAIFFCAPGIAYTLAYGDGAGEAAHYDIEGVLRHAGAVGMDTFSAGSGSMNPRFERSSRKGWVSGKTVMLVAVVLMVVVLGVVLVRTARSLDG